MNDSVTTFLMLDTTMMPMNFVSKIILLIALAILFLNLYYAPINSQCQHQFEEILTQLNIIDSYPQYKRLLREMESMRSANLEREILNAVKYTTRYIRRFETYQRKEITSNHFNSAMSMKHIKKIYKLFDQFKESGSFGDNLKNNGGNLSTLQYMMEVHDGSIKLMTSYGFDDMRSALKSIRNDLKKLQSLQASMISDHRPLSGNKIRLQEMTEVLDQRDPKREAIFFTETTGNGQIKPRFACGVESAARAYPNADIYLLVGFLPDFGLQLLVNEPLSAILRNYKNVHLLNINMDKLFKNTPLEYFYSSGKLNSSQFFAAHSSDVIRVITLYKYGGKYFDLDIITVKNFTSTNFVIYEMAIDGYGFANGFFGYGKGSKVGDIMMEMINTTFDGSNWGANGPKIITDALVQYTGINESRAMNLENMKGFEVIPYERIFPIQYFELDLFFNESLSEKAMLQIRNVSGLLGVHVGNNLMHGVPVRVGSKQAYGLLAQEYCPRAYWNCGEYFD